MQHMSLTSCWLHRVTAEPPQPSAETVPHAPLRDIHTEAVWSPDTPEYIPQFTCQYADADEQPGQSQHDSKADQAAEEDLESAAVKPAAKDATLPKASGALGYGSSSVAPFAFRQTGR